METFTKDNSALQNEGWEQKGISSLLPCHEHSQHSVWQPAANSDWWTERWCIDTAAHSQVSSSEPRGLHPAEPQLGCRTPAESAMNAGWKRELTWVTWNRNVQMSYVWSQSGISHTLLVLFQWFYARLKLQDQSWKQQWDWNIWSIQIHAVVELGAAFWAHLQK